MSDFLSGLRERAKKEGPKRILFVETADEIITAAKQLNAEGLAEAVVVVGSKAEASEVGSSGVLTTILQEDIAQSLEALLRDNYPGKITPEDAKKFARDPLFYGMHLLKIGEGDGIVAGKNRTTTEVIRAGLRIVGKKSGVQTVSSSFYMVVPPFRDGKKEEVLTFADCGIVKHPTAEQLADISIAAADARAFVVGDKPLVAMLSYSTKGSGGDDGPTVNIIRAALDLVRKKRPDIKIEGELQVDTALIESVSTRKMPEGSAIGHGKANVLVFPNLDAGNIAYKLVERLVPGARAIGPVGQGFAKPVNDLSRGASVEDIVYSALIAALQVEKKGE